MSEEPAAEVQLLRRHKVKLIEILSNDADFVLQHADSRLLLSPAAYQRVKVCRIPSEKMTELLDHVLQRGPGGSKGMMELLKEEALQETFPLLCFLKDLQVTSPSTEETTQRKRRAENPEVVPVKKICSNGSNLVTEKQLMHVACAVGKCWRELGRLALDVPTEKLEQIEEDHALHVERVFAMLRCWSLRQRDGATAAHLHALLSQHEDWALPPDKIHFLL